MIVVGITGGIGHGKTTLAKFLAAHARQSLHWESGELVIEVANALRSEHPEHPLPGNLAGINSWLEPLADIVTACVHCPADFTQIALTPERVAADPPSYRKLFDYLQTMQDHPGLQRVEITQDNKQEFRSLMQWLGGYMVKKVNNGIWYDELVRRLHHIPASAGVNLVTIGGVRFPGDAERLRNAGGFIVEIRRPGLEQVDKHDLTERERALIEPDTVIMNDSNLSALQACAERLYADLEVRSLQQHYSAADKIAA